MAQRREFNRWGTLLSQTGTLADTNRLRWQGMLWEGDSTQLYYVRNRWYDPATGRFVSQDPAGYDSSGNQYAFGGNDQVAETDPTGTHQLPFTFGGLPDCFGFALPCIPGGVLTKRPFAGVAETGGFIGPCAAGSEPDPSPFGRPALTRVPKRGVLHYLGL